MRVDRREGGLVQTAAIAEEDEGDDEGAKRRGGGEDDAPGREGPARNLPDRTNRGSAPWRAAESREARVTDDQRPPQAQVVADERAREARGEVTARASGSISGEVEKKKVKDHTERLTLPCWPGKREKSCQTRRHSRLASTTAARGPPQQAQHNALSHGASVGKVGWHPLSGQPNACIRSRKEGRLTLAPVALSFIPTKADIENASTFWATARRRVGVVGAAGGAVPVGTGSAEAGGYSIEPRVRG